MTSNGGMDVVAAVFLALWLACRFISSGVNWTHRVHQVALKWIPKSDDLARQHEFVPV